MLRRWAITRAVPAAIRSRLICRWKSWSTSRGVWISSLMANRSMAMDLNRRFPSNPARAHSEKIATTFCRRRWRAFDKANDGYFFELDDDEVAEDGLTACSLTPR